MVFCAQAIQFQVATNMPAMSMSLAVTVHGSLTWEGLGKHVILSIATFYDDDKQGQVTVLPECFGANNGVYDCFFYYPCTPNRCPNQKI